MKCKCNTMISNRNLGIEILRAILSFWVILFHCLNMKYAYHKFFFFTKTKFYHVPSFTFISFYFTSNIIIKKNLNKIICRFERLFIPYLIYPILVWLINNFAFVVFKTNRYKRIIILKELFLQLLLGYQFLIILWFLFCLIILNIIFIVFSYIFKNNFIFILLIIGTLSIYLQYSKIDYFLYNYHYKIQTPLSNSLSQLPIAIAGISFASSNIIINIKNVKSGVFISLINFLLIFVLFKYDIFTRMRTFNGFENIFASFLFFIGFYYLPLDKINNSIKFIIKTITNYTQGIYCLHVIIRDYIHLTFDKNKTFTGCIIIYLLSYLISFISMKIVGKTKLRYLFV